MVSLKPLSDQQPELGTFELWISGLILDLLFFIISRAEILECDILNPDRIINLEIYNKSLENLTNDLNLNSEYEKI